MRRARRSVFLAGLVSAGLAVGAGGYLVLAATAAPAATTVTVSSPTGTWGPAIKVPGTSADGAEVDSVSCAPGAECMAVGSVLATGNSFTITGKNGTWGTTAQIPGLAKLGPVGTGDVASVSCPASGDCLVAGTDAGQGWYAQEVKGHWGNAAVIPGLATLDTSGAAFSLLASCVSPGNCAVTGEYLTGANLANLTAAVFVASETGYHWVRAAAVAGVPSVANSIPTITALSCASPGNCVLGGGVFSGEAVTTGGSARERALDNMRSARSLLARDSVRPATASSTPTLTAVPFIASEVGGNWHAAVQPSLGLPSTGVALVTSAACPPGGECVVAGVYATSDTASVPGGSFLVSQSGTTWSTPATNSTLGITALACPSAGNCTAAGSDVHGIAAVARENSGKWGSTTDLHGATSLSYKGEKASSSEVEGLACPSAANCSVIGDYTIGSVSSPTDAEGFVAGEANGTWSPVTVPAGLISLNSSGEAPFGGALGPGQGGLACASAANCAAGGSYSTAKGQGAFILTEVPVRVTATTLTRSHSIVTFGDEQAEKLSVAVTSKSGTPGGKVTVKAGATTVCTITLKSGTGSCTLSARQFKAGAYHLVANYLGTWPYAKSASSSWPLTVRS